MIVTPAGPVQTPALTVVFAFKLAVVVLHKVCAVPAFDCERALLLIVTVDVAAAQAPLVTVQVNTEDAPTVKPVTPEVGLFGVVIDPVPEVNDHTPFPTVVLAFKLAVVALHNVCVVPAFD